MIAAKDESESWAEYFSRVERLNEIQSGWAEDEDRVQKLQKFMPKADAIETVHGEEAKKSFENRRQDFIERLEELAKKNREFSQTLDEKAKKTFEDIVLQLNPKDLKEYYDVQ
jgi:uncharacterized protein YeeX (DUF496 family)